MTTMTRLPNLSSDNATHSVCVAMHVDHGFAERVYRELCLPRTEALAPSPGLNLQVIGHNADWLHQQVFRRQLGLTVALGAAILSLPLLLVSPAWIALTVVALLGGFGWSIAGHVQQARRAIDLMNRTTLWDPGRRAMSPEQDARLAEVNDTNLCLYNHILEDDPFPGFGVSVLRHVMPAIDVTRPKDRSKPVQPFTTSRLQGHFGKQYHQARADGITGRNVAFIDATWARHYDPLLPGGGRQPAQKLPPALVRDIADSQSEGARTYVCARFVKHGGMLVCTLSTHFMLVNGQLSWDVSVHLLQPISLDFVGDVGPDTLPRRLPWAIGRAVRVFHREMLHAPGELVRLGWNRRKAEQVQQPAGKLSRRAEDQFLAELGARSGLRERIAGHERLTFNQEVDVKDGFNRLLKSTYDELIRFLNGCNISTRELERQENPTVMQILGNINAQSVAVGTGATANTQAGTP